MENGLSVNSAAHASSTRHSRAAAVNNEYAVIQSDREIYILHLKCPEDEPKQLPCPRASGWCYPLLSLSAERPNVVAISNGSEAYVFDLSLDHLKYVVHGNGRTITCLSFRNGTASSVATGHIDGSICLWDLDNLSRPSQQVNITGQACNALESSPADANWLVSLHGREIYVHYFTGDVWRSMNILNDRNVDTFAWHPRIFGRLVVSTTHGGLRIYDLSDATKDTSTRKSAESSDDESDGGVFGPSDDIQENLQPISRLDLDAPLKTLSWFSERILVGLATDGELVSVYRIGNDNRDLTQSWQCRFDNVVAALRLDKDNETAAIIGIGPTGLLSQDVPNDVVESLHLGEGRSTPSIAPRNDAQVEATITTILSASASPNQSPVEIRSSPCMNPLPISSQKIEESAFSRTSRQLQRMRRMSRFRKKANGLPAEIEAVTDSQALSTSPGPRSLHSDVDLPMFEAEDDFGSPMPFLSPGIPSPRALPHDIPLLNDSIITPPKLRDRPKEPLKASKIDTPFTGPDTDDSDDETFVDNMHGSATFLPGGINVPLPKACGALFAPNGQLLTFFPPKPKLAPIKRESTVELPPDRPSKTERTRKLFATFGNLDISSDSASDDSDSGPFNLPGADSPRREVVPKFTFQPASFPSQHSWKPQDAAAHPAVYTEQPQHRIIVSVHEIADVQSLLPQQRIVAGKYRLLCNEAESGTELCGSNASVADAAGLDEIGDIWRLLAMLLMDQVPLEVLSPQSLQNDVVAIARRATSITRKDSGIGLSTSDKNGSNSKKIHWANHPFGGAWLIRQILAWAEERGDVQSLACFCAILSETERRAPLERPNAEQSMLTHLPTYSHAAVKEPTSTTSGLGSRQVIPVLRTHSATITSLHESPTKLVPRGELSSSLTSQASFNHSDSSATPPFPSPLLSRQSTRLSASGSSSPEFQRGSFSTAAKYYAQSFSERFVYGSSPPAKKADTSPTTSVELSTSLPSGSWPGKSVSFASTTTDSSTQRSLSVSASRAAIAEDAGYDSDKTIEDSSFPHTAKSERSNVALNLSNQSVFAHDVYGIARAKLMPDELASKIAIWNSYYAEQLRCWEMLAQASELEKVFGLTTCSLLEMESVSAHHDGLLPKAASKQRKSTCDICLVAMRGLMQICTSCLHSSHLHCLEKFCEDLFEDEFTCPSGCGCSCAGLPFLVHEIAKQSPQRPTFKKKASFTDPRRWRSRVEGDNSW